MPETAPDGSKAEMALSVAGSADKVNAALGPLGATPSRWGNWIANLSATSLICVLFVYLIRDNASQSRDDRTMFREELKAQRDQEERHTEKVLDKLDAVKSAVEVNTRAVERVKFGTGKGVSLAPPDLSAPDPRAAGRMKDHGGEDGR